MDTALTVRTMRRQSWACMIQEQASSGLTVREWCSQNDISTKTFYYRRKQVQAMLLDSVQESRFEELTPPVSLSPKPKDPDALSMVFSPQLILSVGGIMIGINEKTPRQLLHDTLEILRNA